MSYQPDIIRSFYYANTIGKFDKITIEDAPPVQESELLKLVRN